MPIRLPGKLLPTLPKDAGVVDVQTEPVAIGRSDSEVEPESIPPEETSEVRCRVIHPNLHEVTLPDDPVPGKHPEHRT